MEMEPLTLISATPSAFARMNQIALLLKGIPFKTQNEIPWHATTTTPKYNPLEQLPILLFPDSRAPVFQSAHIQDYIVEKYAGKGPSLRPEGLDDDLLARQIVALSVGGMDALVLYGWESRRNKTQQSQKWMDRQMRKIVGTMKAFNGYVEAAGQNLYVVGEKITIADIAIMCGVEAFKFLDLLAGWELQYPALARYYSRLDELDVFQKTKPVMFDLKEEEVV